MGQPSPTKGQSHYGLNSWVRDVNVLTCKESDWGRWDEYFAVLMNKEERKVSESGSAVN